MLEDAATLSWLGLVKQALPSKDSCWWASANGAVVSSSPGEGRTSGTDYCPAHDPQHAAAAATAVAAVEQLGAAQAAEQLMAACS